MVVLAIEYEVPDLAGWKQIFDKDPMGRVSHGVTRHWIHQDADTPTTSC